MSDVTAVSQDTFAEEVLQAELPTLVDLWAEWCAPCRMLAPVVENLARQQAGRLKVAKLDVQENAVLAAQYGVTTIPTLLLFVNGEVKERIVGYMPEQRIIERLADYLT